MAPNDVPTQIVPDPEPVESDKAGASEDLERDDVEHQELNAT